MNKYINAVPYLMQSVQESSEALKQIASEIQKRWYKKIEVWFSFFAMIAAVASLVFQITS